MKPAPSSTAGQPASTTRSSCSRTAAPTRKRSPAARPRPTLDHAAPAADAARRPEPDSGARPDRGRRRLRPHRRPDPAERTGLRARRRALPAAGRVHAVDRPLRHPQPRHGRRLDRARRRRGGAAGGARHARRDRDDEVALGRPRAGGGGLLRHAFPRPRSSRASSSPTRPGLPPQAVGATRSRSWRSATATSRSASPPVRSASRTAGWPRRGLPRCGHRASDWWTSRSPAQSAPRRRGPPRRRRARLSSPTGRSTPRPSTCGT